MITPHGPVTVGEIADDSITNVKINSSAAIAGSKLDPDTTNEVIGVAAGYKIARGQVTTSTASDTVVTGLTTVVAAVAVLDDDPVLTAAWATASIGDQAAAPAAGSIYIKTWMPTSTSVTDPVAATTFTKKVNWIAIGE